MKVCNEVHEPIVYSTPVCPACMIIKHFTEKIAELNERIEVLENDVTATNQEMVGVDL